MYFGEEKKTGFGKAIINSAGCGILVEKEQEYGIRTPHFTRPCYFIPSASFGVLKNSRGFCVFEV